MTGCAKEISSLATEIMESKLRVASQAPTSS